MIKQRPVYLFAALLCLLVGCGGDDNNGPGPVTPVAANTALGMNEGSGTTLADTSGHGHTGTLLNGPVWVAGQATYGQALSFDGIDDAVSVASPATYNFGTADFTIEMWIKRDLLGGGQRHLFSKCDAGAWVTGCKEFYFKANNQLAFGSFATGDTISSTIADTNWHHVAVTFTDTTTLLNILNIYVDGVLVTSATKALEADDPGHVVTVGNLHGNNTFSGVLDEVRFYSRALTLAEIQADMTTPIVPWGSDTDGNSWMGIWWTPDWVVLTGIAASNDDVITGNNDMGGQDVLPVPNVYNGWVQNLPQAFKDQLTLVQKSNLNPIRMRMNRIDRLA